MGKSFLFFWFGLEDERKLKNILDHLKKTHIIYFDCIYLYLNTKFISYFSISYTLKDTITMVHINNFPLSLRISKARLLEMVPGAKSKVRNSFDDCCFTKKNNEFMSCSSHVGAYFFRSV